MTTAPEPAPSRRSPGRPRDPAVEARIVDAALEEYAERGWSGFTIDGVARRASVGKSTIYLRWDDKESLLRHAVHQQASGIEQVDTGSLQGDLRELASNLLRHYLDPLGWATLRIAVDGAGGATPTMLSDTAAAMHRDAARAVIDRAVARGEVTADLPAAALIDSLHGSVTMQALKLSLAERASGQIDPEVATRPTVDFAVAAIRDFIV